MELQPLFTNPYLAFCHCLMWELLADGTECDYCNGPLQLIHDNSTHFGIRCYCPKCRYRPSIYHNTIFDSGKLKPDKVLLLLYFWAHEYTPGEAEYETRLSQPTITNYYQAFRDACIEYTELRAQKLGGDNCTVEIDETQYVKRKNHQGRLLPNSDIWIFGGICRETKKMFAVPVLDRSANTLLPLIQENIADGTKIISDCWPAYNTITSLPQNYQHETVNHSQNFVDPNTGAHTQHIERYWRKIKKMKKKYEGVPRGEVESHVAEAIWRNNCMVKKGNCFVKALELIRQTHYSKK